MGVLFIAGVVVRYWAEANGTTALMRLVSPAATWKARRSASALSPPRYCRRHHGRPCGAVNDARSFTALGGMIPLINIQLGEIIVGGVGAGMYGMLLFVDPDGLRRRPDGRPHAGICRQEDRGEGSQDGDARHPDPAADVSRLDGGRWLSGHGLDGQSRPHGFTEVLYAYTSQTGNNGSAFAGLTGNIFFYNLTGAVAMFIGRFWMIVPAMAIAGALAEKKTVPPSAGTFPTTGGLFVGLTVGVILIVGGLTFFPALALGPIVEHLAMTAGTLFSAN